MTPQDHSNAQTLELLRQQMADFQDQFDRDSRSYFDQHLRPKLLASTASSRASLLFESMSYSFFSGGKRFRPFLTYLTALAFKQDPKIVFPIGLALEMVHTYSLIHDDLPCMDNDDFRRGQPTNHKVYGEDVALLAGDSLLTESFAALALTGSRVDQLISEFVLAIGAQGMVLGQVLDMKSSPNMTAESLGQIHELKTGRLISAAMTLSAKIFSQNVVVLERVKRLGDLLGLAFQIKDDLLDALEKDQDHKSYVHVIGSQETIEFLNQTSRQAQDVILELDRSAADSGVSSEFFRFAAVIQYNQQRIK